MNCTDRWNIEARGFNAGINPLKYNFPILMLQLVSVFVISRFLHFFLKHLKQPTFLCNILAGIILGPSCLGRNKKFRETFFPKTELPVVYFVASISVTLFLFLVSVKLDLTMILKTSGKKIWTIGLSCCLLPFATNMCLFFFLARFVYPIVGKYKVELVHIFLALSLTSFPHVAHLLDDINILTSEIGNIAMSCAVINDSIRMLLVVGLVFVERVRVSGWYWTLVSLFVLLIIGIFVLRPIPLWIIKRTPEGKPVKEIYVIGMFVGALFSASLSHVFFGSIAVGATVFGMLVPTGPPLGSTLVQKMELMVMELFCPLMFVVLGLNVDVFSLRALGGLKHFIILQIFFYGGFFGKLVGTLIPATLIHKMTLKNSLSLGLMMNIKGLIEAMAFLHWKFQKNIGDQTYTILLLSTMSSTAIITPLIASLHKPRERIHVSSNKFLLRTIQAANKSVGELRVLLCIHEEDTVGSIISLLEASNPTSTCPITACVVHLVDLVDRDAPMLVPYHKRGLAWKSTKSDYIMRAFTNYSKFTDCTITIQPFTLVAPVKNMHDCIHRLAQDKATPLIIVPINKFRRGVDHLHGGDTLKNLGTCVQENAPCTVGILVNMGVNDPMRYTRFSYHVAVIFLGGPDDREALAYGIRMSGHPSVSITVLRIFFRQGDKKVDKVELRTDDYLVDEFKERNVGNACAVYCEEVVDDIVHAIGLIKSLGSDYDLVVVGRRRCTDKSIDEEMVSWCENPELGVLGEVFVTSESIGGTTSILVMQHFDEVDA